MKKINLYFLILSVSIVFLSGPIPVYAAHEECDMCHKAKDPNEAEDPYEFIIELNRKEINFRTGKPLTGSSALCLGCHSENPTSEDAGMPINLNTTHPLGIIPQNLEMPEESIGFQGESSKISCLSCHDQHPDNKNYKLLRWPAGEGENISKFCYQCHLAEGYAETGSHADCTLCHSVHNGHQEILFTEIPNRTTVNPRTGKPMRRIGSYCMACHAAEPDGTGYLAIDLRGTHPVGVKPKKVKLAGKLKGFPGEEEAITCLSCHDHHPRNKNFKYLRWSVKGTYYLNTMCQQCHPEKGNVEGTGPHGQCALCHANHTGQGPYMLSEMLNNTTKNPTTRKPFGEIGQICLACHAKEPDGTGYKVINLENSHPTGIKPERATLPKESTAFPEQKGQLVCISCHDQHPSNNNYKYLRWSVKKRKDVLAFCLRCHPYYEKQLSEKMINIDLTRIGVHFNKFRSVEEYLKYLDSIKR
jgi:predicted CXXCH cytochrome family protein